MSDEATVLSQYVPGFTANLNLSPQQTMVKVVGNVDSDLNHAEPGQLFNADDVGTSDPTDVTTRVGATPDKHIAETRRVGYFKEFEDSAWFDNVDQVRRITDPTSAKMQALMAGMARKRDGYTITQGLGVAYELTDDTTAPSAVAFLAGQIVASNDVAFAHQDETVPSDASDYGLSVAKLIHAGLLLDDSELEGQRLITLGPVQKADLLRRTPVTNQFYADVKALVDGKVNHILGFDVVQLPRGRMPLKATTTDVRSLMAWIKPAIVYKARPITQARIAIRHDRSDTPQAYYKASHGAVRRYDKGVVRIDCKEVG